MKYTDEQIEDSITDLFTFDTGDEYPKTDEVMDTARAMLRVWLAERKAAIQPQGGEVDTGAIREVIFSMSVTSTHNCSDWIEKLEASLQPPQHIHGDGGDVRGDDEQTPLSLCSELLKEYGSKNDKDFRVTDFVRAFKKVVGPKLLAKTPVRGAVSADTLACRDITYIAECFGAALFEGWEEALIKGDMDRIRDIWNRRISFALNRAMSSVGKIPRKETPVRGVSDADAEMVLQKYTDICVEQHSDDAPRSLRVEAMRDALEAFLKGGDGHE